jgi:metal-dependent HD superfamily phosphatase/phosphodiesterase
MQEEATGEDSLRLPFREFEAEATEVIESSLAERPKARRFWKLISSDPEVEGNWKMANFVAVTRMGMNDHGKTHAKIATASALTMLNLLLDHGRQPDIVVHELGDVDDAFLAVTAATLCHDFGNLIHRTAHENLSVTLALPVLDRLLPEIYPQKSVRFQIRSFILSAIYSHLGDPPPLTLEAGLVCVGDATDMTKGRGRQAFASGSITIHTVSALAVDRVIIRKGAEKPIELQIHLSNPAGIFQVQEILAPRVRASSLADSIDIIALTTHSQREGEIVGGIRMKGSRFVPFTDY